MQTQQESYFQWSAGLDAEKVWILSSKIVMNPSNTYRAVLKLDAGKEQTTGDPNAENAHFKSIDAKITYQNQHIFGVYAAADKWGTYDFQRTFGIKYPRQYKLSYTYLLDKGVKEENASKIGIKWMHRTLDENSAPEDNITKMSEIQTFVEYHF